MSNKTNTTMKDELLNPTPAQVKYRNRLWAEALRKNKKKARGVMRRNGGRCCLAVAENVAIECGLDVNRHASLPHIDVANFFGWGQKMVMLNTPKGFIPAAHLNDVDIYSANGSKGMSHKRIAECVENTFVHPSKKKWSFSL